MRTQDRPMDKVIFRAQRDGTIIAVWPAIPADNEGNLCQTYEHVGQHGAGDWNVIVRNSFPATPQQYNPLLRELIQIGYNPIIIRRVTWQLDEHRKQVAKSPCFLAQKI